MSAVFRLGLLTFLALLAGAVICSFDYLSAAFDEPVAAQPTLPMETFEFSGSGGRLWTVRLEVALTTRQQMTGEMFRTVIPRDGGMIFPQAYPQRMSMWMKNCPVPEDMVFVGSDGRVSRVVADVPADSLEMVVSQGRVSAAIELAAGVAAERGIVPGVVVRRLPQD